MSVLSGRVALLTGATGRLGRAIAAAYAQAGASLMLSAKQDAALQELGRELSAAHRGPVAAVACDLADPADIERLAAAARTRFGGVDILINAAAAIGPIGLTWDIAWDAWRQAVETNLFSVVRLSQLCIPMMPRTTGRGKIINISGGGGTSPRPRFSAYATAKTGVVRFTETLAHELEGLPIDVNCIAPGILNSRLTRAVVSAGPERAGTHEYDVAVEAVQREADSRGRAAELSLFLGSPESDGISGRLLSAVWDDWTSLRSDSKVLRDPQAYTLRRIVPPSPRSAGARTADPALTICVAGLWHLGSVTSACLAGAGHRVIGYDGDASVIAKLQHGTPPIAEPGLNDLIARSAADGRLTFSNDPASARDAEIVWVTWDTPVDDHDRPDVGSVFGRFDALLPHLRDDALVLVSSQLPVGSIAEMERRAAAAGRRASFACVAENLRLGQALDAFMRPERIVVGIRDTAGRERIAALLAPFSVRIEWMRVESAEMTKHALNAFLATSIAFINEIASVCETVGADAAEVARGLKSDHRIGPHSYLTPGRPFAGGTLARDVEALTDLRAAGARPLHLLRSIKPSNDHHRRWAIDRLRRELGTIDGRTIAVWGLVYKPWTDTLRRSGALELCEALVAEGATVRAYDPAVSVLPPRLAGRVTLAGTALDAAAGADAIIIATDWPEFLTIPSAPLLVNGRAPLVLDASGFLAASLGGDPRLRYVSVGHP